jgi:amidohydrolase
MQEADLTKPYASKIPGQMHACGHDAHTAILLATARELKAREKELTCRVKLLFTPAEEYIEPGCEKMVKDGVMDDIDCIIGQHVEITEPSGVIDVSTDDVTAISIAFNLKFYGRRDHALRQYNAIDAIMMAVNAYNAIEMMMSKNIDGREVVIFNVGKIEGGQARNIVAAECEMECTIRSLSTEMADIAVKRIKEIGEATAEAWGGRFEFVPIEHLPKIVNDRTVADRVVAAARAVVGEENVTYTTKPDKEKNLGGEDFSFYLEKKPGCMFHTGIRNEAKGCIYGGHTDTYKLDEDVLEPASEIIVRFVLDNMNGIEGI